MNKNSLSTSIILFILAVVLLVFSVFNDRKNEQSKLANEALEVIQKQVAPYEAKDLMDKVLIIQDFKNSSVKNKSTNIFEKTVQVNGSITDGYLYIRAEVDNKALTGFDDIYVKMIESAPGAYFEYGGHLIQGQSLDTPKSENETELLFDLSAVKYKKNFTDSNNEVLSGNWLSVLNGSSSKKVLGFSSTARKGDIKEVYIYYRCLKNTECSISVSP